MYLTTVGRRTGRNREVIIGYFEDGADLVTMAMNGWGEAEPAWWLNVQAHPDVTANLVDGTRQVTGREAHGDERDRLWARWRQVDKNLDSYAARRSKQTAVVIFEPSDIGHLRRTRPRPEPSPDLRHPRSGRLR